MPINQKGLAGIFWIILGLVLAGLLAWKLFSPKPESQVKLTQPQVSSVKTKLTYNNQDLSFSYPPKYEVVEDSETSFIKRGNTDFRKNFTSYVGYAPASLVSALILQDPTMLEPDNFDKAPFLIWVFDNPDNLSAKDWYDKYWYYPFMWGVFSYDQKAQNAPKLESSISGQLALGGAVLYQEQSPEYIYISSGGKMYLLRILNTLEQDSKEQILKSLNLP